MKQCNDCPFLIDCWEYNLNYCERDDEHFVYPNWVKNEKDSQELQRL